MIFSLEALQAGEGDCLLLHYGTPAAPKAILIDGGRAGIYDRVLAPRLAELAAQRGAATLEMVIVSHIDADHISGVLDLFDACAQAAEDGTAPPAEPKRLWHNAFGALTGLGDAEAPARPAAVGPPADFQGGTAAIAASVGQGVRLSDSARRLALPVNDGQGGLIAAPAAGGAQHDLGDGLTFTVIHPDSERLDDLRTLFEQRARRSGQAAALAAAYTDDSVPNLSSIVMLAEVEGRRMLLTGDARGDDILNGLQRAGLLDDGAIELDVLKVPHHGSDRNVETDFFRRVRAEHYVISGDGKHGNPESATLQMLFDARGSDGYTVHMTNHDGADGLRERLDAFLDRQPLPVVFRLDDRSSLTVELLEALPS